MTEQKLDQMMKEYFSEKEEVSPNLKRKVILSLARADMGKQRRQFFLLALAVTLYSVGIFAAGIVFTGTSPAGLWLLANMCLAVAGSSILVLITGKQNKYKEA